MNVEILVSWHFVYWALIYQLHGVYDVRLERDYKLWGKKRSWRALLFKIHGEGRIKHGKRCQDSQRQGRELEFGPTECEVCIVTSGLLYLLGMQQVHIDELCHFAQATHFQGTVTMRQGWAG